MSLPDQPAPAWMLGIDVGGTKTALALIRFPEGEIAARTALETPQRDASGAPFLERVVAAAAGLIAQRRCAAIGVSVCELVDLEGVITSRHRLHWAGLPVRARLAQLAPTVIDSDVRAAALAEARWGAGRPHDEFLYLNIGTGISACWVKGGKPHVGARGNALILASSPVSFVCPHCGRPGQHVVEEIAGGSGLAAQYARRSGRQGSSARDVLEAAGAGDRDAEAVIDHAALTLGASLGLAVNLLDPECVIVGGGLGLAGGRYWERLLAATRDHVWAESTRGLPIRPAALGGDSALIGAAARAWLMPQST